MLESKNIVLGVTGGIAAYKSCDLVSRLVKAGANVDVIMTENAINFISPLTFQALSSNQVIVDMFKEPKYWEIQHISLAKKADVVVIAPATANIIGKIANGIADDMLTTTAMATTAPLVFAPAMNSNMYENKILQSNIDRLRELGYHFIEPGEGRLACGDIGKGKMAEPYDIELCINEILNKKKDLQDKTIIITAGPTREPIDPVRFISNHSTGKMGYAIAEKAAERGAKVYLISGPTALKAPKGVRLISVNSAKDMQRRIMEHFDEAQIIIKSAAVADYAPAVAHDQKIKKKDENLTIELVKNPDILYELGKIKGDKILVGFAMETQNLIENAKEKVLKKNLDFIVANDLFTEGAGFATDTNIVKIIDRGGNIESVPKMSKHQLADLILDRVMYLQQLGEVNR
ncbi:bifunctional phosphopantothenoylcysteine decarboxylase/phosphopantothenate--cysteine ligase CoaBC [Lutispora saccharofermentans]|uniref:Coenzyme A biosynthesis bifunctional protein CoaBC n=1 Tax=Lutispora saccharofermentans TaxID=3024236 RepID=A0ABT1NCK8_9FIRM|nr:bifunctional phosphopantothenoylcysteine decarboxylase/phosphopantothenate--cysteine ligase CoaBC [Lutispora saccharofermentans]MCQ1528066.1 bifunctional phosphopantothenoylcysteine decarboxylase/phosphopantothenate--cysteine ligase CoaBC [Lutispora saccharofermentans]